MFSKKIYLLTLNIFEYRSLTIHLCQVILYHSSPKWLIYVSSEADLMSVLNQSD